MAGDGGEDRGLERKHTGVIEESSQIDSIEVYRLSASCLLRPSFFSINVQQATRLHVPYEQKKNKSDRINAARKGRFTHLAY